MNCHTVLTKWKSCQSYKLVDPWEHQENYSDSANVDQKAQEKNYEQTKATLRQWANITEFFRMYSIQAAQKMKKESLDFVYLDARHDFCAMMEDLEAYWPLVTPGGILAGHDYMTSPEVRCTYVVSMGSWHCFREKPLRPLINSYCIV